MSYSNPNLHLPIQIQSHHADVDSVSGFPIADLVKQILREDPSQEQIEKLEEIYAELGRKHNDELLATFAGKMSTISGCIAACFMTGSVHGYMFQNALIQMEDGACFRQVWIEGMTTLNTAPIQRTEGDFDLQKQLLLLRNERWNSRSTESAIHNVDQRSGIEGRGAILFTVVGGDSDWLTCSRLLLHGEYPNNALNRILLMLEDLAGKVTLV